MEYFYVKPDVAGGLGDHTILDARVHPPIVSTLHYEMDGWFGDAILRSFPVYIVTEAARQGLVDAGLTGMDFAEVEVTTSEEFRELFPGLELPPFVWLKPTGEAGQDDFGTVPNARLVVSDRALKVLRTFGIENALVEPFDGLKRTAR